MAQILVYGLRSHLDAHRRAISDALHACAVDVFALPRDKRFHRFISLEPADFIYPADRTERYTIIEVHMFEGRSVETKKQFIGAVFERMQHMCGIAPHDVELTMLETPRHNWGIRGLPGDELVLSYTVTK